MARTRRDWSHAIRCSGPRSQCFVVLAVAIGGLFSYYYIKYDRIIEQRFKGPVFSSSAKIYAIPQRGQGRPANGRSRNRSATSPRGLRGECGRIADGQLPPAERRDRNQARLPVLPQPGASDHPHAGRTGDQHHRTNPAIWKPTNSNRKWSPRSSTRSSAPSGNW